MSSEVPSPDPATLEGSTTGHPPSSSTSPSPSNNNDNNNNSTNEDVPLRADELSRRMFLGGLLGLPWLWIVHTLYWYGKQRGMDDGRQLHDSSQSNGKLMT
jgi:hypothetical protein